MNRAFTRTTSFVSTVALIVVGGACGRGLESIAPVGFVAADPALVEGWIGELAAKRPRQYEIRPWRYRNEQGAAAGRAVVRLAPPDSLRLDYRGPFGRSGTAAIAGDSTLWVTDDGSLEALVTFAPLFWTALGVPPFPPESSALFSLVGDDFRAWRYILAGDTLDFVLSGSPVDQLLGEFRRGGTVLGQVTVELDTITRMAVRSRIDFWDVSRFELTVASVDTLATFDSTVWQNN